MAKTHPHIDKPNESDLLAIVSSHSEEVQQAYLALHRLIIATLPDIRFSVDTVDGGIGYAAHQYGYNGWGMVAVSPHSRWATFVLLAGARIPDPHGILQGTSSMRHIKFHGAQQVNNQADHLRDFIGAAAILLGAQDV
jgi:hypothetical protein